MVRGPGAGAGLLPGGQAHGYGFTDKVLDGIMVSVNITSLAFTASFQMSRILVSINHSEDSIISV